ncbi:hypothetical protein Tco_0128439 [Tanacetum coccineum]
MKVTMEACACLWQLVKSLQNTAKIRGFIFMTITFLFLMKPTFLISCLLDFYNVRGKIAVKIRPQLILNAEKELGIVVGLQDRLLGTIGIKDWPLVYAEEIHRYTAALGISWKLV